MITAELRQEVAGQQWINVVIPHPNGIPEISVNKRALCNINLALVVSNFCNSNYSGLPEENLHQQ